MTCQAICKLTGVQCGLPQGHYGTHQNGDRNGNWQVQTGNTWDDSECCEHEIVNLIGGPACRKCGWTP